MPSSNSLQNRPPKNIACASLCITADDSSLIVAFVTSPQRNLCCYTLSIELYCYVQRIFLQYFVYYILHKYLNLSLVSGKNRHALFLTVAAERS